MSGRAVLRTFGSRNEAEAVRALLSGSGIDAFVDSDYCGALDPALAFGRGVELLVAEEDLERAALIVSRGISSGARE